MPQKKDHTQLLCDVSELAGIFSDSSSLESFLQKTVEMVAEHLQSDVCSIYLFYEETQELVLKATRGLKSEAVGRVRMPLGEGLTGLAVKELRPICERNASATKGFKFFPGIGEELYNSFLAVPILRGQMRIGALVIQNAEKNCFADEDINACKIVASQLANILEMAKVLISLKDVQPESSLGGAVSALKFIKARAGAEGFAYAPAVVYERELCLQKFPPEFFDRPLTLEDFKSAVDRTARQLESAQEQIEEKLSDVASLIFSAHLLMLKDADFIGTITGQIGEGVHPVRAVLATVRKFALMFEELPNDYLKEKKHDVIDIGLRLMENLVGRDLLARSYREKVVVAQQLYPSEILSLYSQDVRGIVLLSGGVTSHIVILAQSLEIPLVISDIGDLIRLPASTPVLVDGDQGNIYINPDEEVVASFRQTRSAVSQVQGAAADLRGETWTADGVRVVLLANINLLSDLTAAAAAKAEGIGLYRTEFPFIIRTSFPTEEEQYVVYRKLTEGMPGKEITFRTLDIGGDKVLSYYNYANEENPFLGMRSIRFSLRHKAIFRQQVRAILRAGVEARLRIMFPMISSLEEFLESKELVAECVSELQAQGIPCHAAPEVGMMVELPAVLEIMSDLVPVVDFFSIGTNDFIQYMLAVDRTNEKVADLYLPHHPAIIRSLKRIIAAASAGKKDVSICGQMAQDIRFIPFLLGIGCRKFSLDPHHIPKVQSRIYQTSLKAAQVVSRNLLGKDLLKDIQTVMDEQPEQKVRS